MNVTQYTSANLVIQNVPFFGYNNGPAYPKVSVYAVSLPNLVAGEILLVSGQFVLDVRTSGFLYPVFASCLVDLLDHAPTQLDEPFSQFQPVTVAGEDMWIGSTITGGIPYKRFVVSGSYTVPAACAGNRWARIATWVSSAQAVRGDWVNLVGQNGRLDVLRITP